MPDDKPTTRLNLELSTSLYERFQGMCRDREISVSARVRLLIQHDIREWERTQRLPKKENHA